MSDKNIEKALRANRRRRRVRSKVVGTAECPRLTVARSLKNVFVQIIDDEKGTTLASMASNAKAARAELDGLKTKVDMAHKVGEMIARVAKEKGIEKVVFDRNKYRYQGRIRAVAEGAREGGLEF